MKDEKMTSQYYKDLDGVFRKITDILNNYEKSQILQDHFFDQFESSIYATLIDNFFNNLNQENVSDLNIPQNKIGLIKKEYETLRKNVKSSLLISSKNKLDEKQYSDFKSDLKSKFPEFSKIILEVEKIVSVKDMKKYIARKKKEIKATGKKNVSIEDIMMTKSLEAYLNEHHEFPTGTKLGKSFSNISMKSLESLIEGLMKNLQKDRPRMLKEHKKIREGFEDRLYKRWKIVFDSLESLIVVCLESGEDKKNKLSKGKTIINPKHVALIKIHARGIQISYEILALVRSGFADGAYARWRSIHELAMITFFLRDSNEDVSRRYLEHDVMKKFRESKDYRKYYKKLGYPPLTRKELNMLRKEHDKLLQKYGSEFEYKSGFEWIPTSILSNRNFRSLEEHIHMDKFHPFYNWSSNAVHSGSKGFERLGVMSEIQNEILVVGPTNYGFADPIDSTAISISHITSNLLLLEPDFEDILIMQALQKYIKEIGENALDVQKNLKKEATE